MLIEISHKFTNYYSKFNQANRKANVEIFWKKRRKILINPLCYRNFLIFIDSIFASRYKFIPFLPMITVLPMVIWNFSQFFSVKKNKKFIFPYNNDQVERCNRRASVQRRVDSTKLHRRTLRTWNDPSNASNLNENLTSNLTSNLKQNQIQKKPRETKRANGVKPFWRRAIHPGISPTFNSPKAVSAENKHEYFKKKLLCMLQNSGAIENAVKWLTEKVILKEVL